MKYMLYLLVATLCINIALAIFVLAKNFRHKAAQIFTLIITGNAIWIVGVISVFYDLSLIPPLIAAKVAFGGGALLGWMFFYFSLIFPEKIDLPKLLKWFNSKLLHVIGLILIILGISPYVIVDITSQSLAPLTIRGPFYPLYALIELLFLFFGLLVLAIKFFKFNGIKRQKVAYVFTGLFLTVIVSSFTNLIYPFFTDSSALAPIGPLAIIFVSISIIITIIRYRLFDITIQLQKTVNFFLPIIISTTLTVLLAYVLYEYATWHGERNGIILLIFYTISYKIFSYLFTKTRLNYLLFPKTYHYHQSLLSFAEHVSEHTNLHDLTNAMQMAFLGHGFIESFAFFIITNQETRSCHALETHNLDLKKLALCADSTLHPTLHQKFFTHKEPIVIEELTYHPLPEGRELQTLFHPLTGGVCIPLFVSSDLTGLILLGSKTTGGAYTTEDIDIFEKVSVPLAVAVTKATLFSHYQNQNTELKRDKQNLETGLMELKNAKYDFLKVVNHQLNTPLSVMRSIMSMIQEGDVPLEEVREYVQHINPKMEAFAQIVHDMLDAAEFTGASAELQFATVEVNTLLTSLIEAYSPLAKTHNVTPELHLEPHIARILTDPEKFKTAVSQLIKNALIYGHGKPVQITTYQTNGHVTITIKDQGRGFDTEETEQIGTLFYRGKNTANYLADGSGLGLFTAKKIIEASGGTLTWSSSGPGQGSTFTIELPKAIEFSKSVTIK